MAKVAFLAEVEAMDDLMGNSSKDSSSMSRKTIRMEFNVTIAKGLGT